MFFQKSWYRWKIATHDFFDQDHLMKIFFSIFYWKLGINWKRWCFQTFWYIFLKCSFLKLFEQRKMEKCFIIEKYFSKMIIYFLKNYTYCLFFWTCDNTFSTLMGQFTIFEHLPPSQLLHRKLYSLFKIPTSNELWKKMLTFITSVEIFEILFRPSTITFDAIVWKKTTSLNDTFILRRYIQNYLQSWKNFPPMKHPVLFYEKTFVFI